MLGIFASVNHFFDFWEKHHCANSKQAKSRDHMSGTGTFS